MSRKAIKNAVKRVIRGGSFNGTWDLRTSDRCWYEPVDRVRLFGFRLVARKK